MLTTTSTRTAEITKPSAQAAEKTAKGEHYCYECGAFAVLDIFSMCRTCWKSWAAQVRAGLI
jgi:ribosomal protein S14